MSGTVGAGARQSAGPLRYHLTRRSNNRKTGPIVVTTASRASCPASCKLRGAGCYAEGGPLRIWWDRLSEPGGSFGLDFRQFVEELRGLPGDSVVRLNQAGDLPGRGRRLDRGRCLRIADALGHVAAAWTYTHYPPTEHNVGVAAEMERRGVVVNFSHERAAEVETLAPAVVLVAGGGRQRTADGRKVVVCPAQTGRRANCEECLLCAKGVGRGFVVGFVPHGSRARLVQERWLG